MNLVYLGIFLFFVGKFLIWRFFKLGLKFLGLAGMAIFLIYHVLRSG